MFRYVPECSGMFRNVPGCSGMFRDVPCSGFYRRPTLCRTIAVILFVFKKDNFPCLHVNGCSYIQMSDRDC